MRGDPEFDREIGKLYAGERKRKRRKLFIVQLVAVLLVLVSFWIYFTVESSYRYNPALAPYGFAVLGLLIYDEEALSLNQRFTIIIALSLPVVMVMRLFYVALS